MLQVSPRSTNFWVYMKSKNNLIATTWLKAWFRYEIATTSNSELNDKVKGYCIEQESDYWVTLHPLSNCVLDSIQLAPCPRVVGIWMPLVLAVRWVGSFTVTRLLLPQRGVTVWTPGMPALTTGSRPGPWPRSWTSVWGAGWRIPPLMWWLPILRMPGSLQMRWRSLGPEVWTTPGSWSMFVSYHLFLEI